MGSSPVRVTSKKDKHCCLSFFAVCDTVTGKSEPIGSREPLKTAMPCRGGPFRGFGRYPYGSLFSPVLFCCVLPSDEPIG